MTTALSTAKPISLADLHPVVRQRAVDVFARLNSQFGVKIADAFGNTKPAIMQAEWGQALADLHEREIVRGLDRTGERIFPPTLGEFLQLCRPCLNAERAFLEAGDCLRQRDAGEVGDWTHPAVWRAASAMSPEVRGGDWKQHRTRWTYTLERELAKGWGEEPGKPPLQIAHSPATTSPPNASQRAALAELRAKFPSRRAASDHGATA